MAHISVEDAAFLAGLQRELKVMDQDGEQILHGVGEHVVSVAKARAPRLQHPDPRYRPGELAASIDLRSGRDAKGPWVDVGTDDPIAIFMEYGTFKDRAQPFMRPALSMAARAIRATGGRAARRSPRARAFGVRAGKRTLIRRALRSGQISSVQARGLSSQVSSTFRFRARRRPGG